MMIMRITTLTFVAICFTVCSVAKSETKPSEPKLTEIAEKIVQERNSRKNTMNTVNAMTIMQEYVAPVLCTYFPDYCERNHLQSSRGIQSYLATAGTMFAGVLGVILMKIKILVVLSLMTTVIGKMLLFYAFLKSDHYHHHGHKYGHHLHHGHHHHAPLVKYTRDKYYIKNTPVEHSHDVIVDHPPHHSPYHGHADNVHHRQSVSASEGVSYYK